MQVCASLVVSTFLDMGVNFLILIGYMSMVGLTPYPYLDHDKPIMDKWKETDIFFGHKVRYLALIWVIYPSLETFFSTREYLEY